jgi:Family of unknown function (DUF6600)/FecR protein
MRRLFMPDKHWLLLSILMVLGLLAAPVSRAQGQSQPGSRTQGQSSDQVPDPAQNQDQVQSLHQEPSQSPDQAQGAEQIQPQDKIQEQDQIPATPSYDPNSEDHYSHARIVRISYVDGQVRIDHGQGYESATMNVPVTEHNWLQTRSDGWAEVQFEDGSMVRVAPDTVIAFTELSRSSSGSTVSTVDLDQGEAEFKVAQRGDSEFHVTVKNKTISLGGSAAFRVTSTNADPLEVAVWKGEVAIRDSESGGEVAVKKNETFTLDPTDVSQYALDKGAEADGLDQWSKERDDYLSTYAARGGYSQSPYQYGTGDLNYYGAYSDDPGYGTVWQPNGVNINWSPFGNGYWAYSPGFGYTWVSAYPWGWLPFRYGNWVFINGRGWCWVPGNWQRWHTGPTWVNAPPGFRAPAPPANKIVINGAPGGRVPRTNIPNEAGGVGPRYRAPAVGNRTTNHDGDGGAGFRGNRRVFTNDDVARVPRTDIPKTDVPAKPAPDVIDADRKPKEIDRQPVTDVQRQPQVNRPHADHEPPANRGDDAASRPGRSRTADASPAQQPSSAPVDSRPARQPDPPVHVHTQPAQPPVRQSPPASAPVRQSAPPAASHDDSSSRSSGKPK